MRWLIPFLLLCGSALAQPPNIPGGPPIQCTASVVYDNTYSGTAVQIVTSPTVPAGSPPYQIYVCGYTVTAGLSTVNVGFSYGTGLNCGTCLTPGPNGLCQVTPQFQLSSTMPGVADGAPFFRGMLVPKGQNVCLVANANVSIQAVLYYLMVLSQ